MNVVKILKLLIEKMDDEGRAYAFVDQRYKCKLYCCYPWLFRLEINDTMRGDDLVALIKEGGIPLIRKSIKKNRVKKA
jgi:hypothetical protein